MSLEDIVKSLATNTMSSIQNLEKQMSQIATTVNRLESQVGGKLPSQPEVNPKNVSAMTLRSGKEVEAPKKALKKVISTMENDEEIEKEIEKEGHSMQKLKDVFELNCRDELEVVLMEHLELETTRDIKFSTGVEEMMAALHSLNPISKRLLSKTFVE
ncbi:uncharacterized protein A4U43_C05F32090 [Asparagus officinalis]|uniref:Uncharacterized protein n=1 Tax=Asparagus officinalis TaxID=4686 RepID=A0A5P1EW07_ASPOF|nr:uncharacterized protein A4U43_C05F32090 [Asparagus officinalis]